MYEVKEIHGQRFVVFEDDVDTGTAYDMTQCSDDIKDGDILIVPSEVVVGFLFKAWPTAVTPTSGHFHASDYLDNAEDFKPYRQTIELARAFAIAIASKMEEASA